MTVRCIAVAGAGNIGRRHLRALGQIPGVKPVAISRRAAASRELEQEGYRVAATIREAAAAGATRCIVATETGHHAAAAEAALDAGCDVLVEKPLALDASEGARVLKHAEAHGKTVQVGCLLRFSESLGRFKDLLPRVGALHAVHIACQSYLPDWRSGRPFAEYYSAGEDGGVLRDLIHDIDYAGWIFGWPDSLQGRLWNTGRLGIVAEEAADLMWQTAAGPHVTVHLDFLSRPARRVMAAFGSDGTLEWDGVRGETTLRLPGEQSLVHTAAETIDQMLLKQDRAFADGAPLGSGGDAVRALAVCDAARRASQSSKLEKVAYP